MWAVVVLVVLSNPPSSKAFIQDLQETLGKAKEYLEDMAPYLTKGLKTVQKIEEIIDSAIAEECPYECPRGKIPIPKPGHVQTSNGCGAIDMFFDDSEDSWIKLEKDFTKCCNSHDECYDTCNEDKDMCDLTFKKCLYKVCQMKKYAFLDEKTCKLKAKLAYLAVIGVGCQMYKDAQTNACQCVKASASDREFNRQEL